MLNNSLTLTKKLPILSGYKIEYLQQQRRKRLVHFLYYMSLSLLWHQTTCCVRKQSMLETYRKLQTFDSNIIKLLAIERYDYGFFRLFAIAVIFLNELRLFQWINLFLKRRKKYNLYVQVKFKNKVILLLDQWDILLWFSILFKHYRNNLKTLYKKMKIFSK